MKQSCKNGMFKMRVYWYCHTITDASTPSSKIALTLASRKVNRCSRRPTSQMPRDEKQISEKEDDAISLQNRAMELATVAIKSQKELSKTTQLLHDLERGKMREATIKKETNRMERMDRRFDVNYLLFRLI